MNGISLSPPLSNGTCIITEFSAKTLEGKGRFWLLLLLLLFSFRLLFDELETAAATTTTRARDPPSGAACGKQHFFSFTETNHLCFACSHPVNYYYFSLCVVTVFFPFAPFCSSTPRRIKSY